MSKTDVGDVNEKTWNESEVWISRGDGFTTSFFDWPSAMIAKEVEVSVAVNGRAAERRASTAVCSRAGRIGRFYNCMT